MKAARKDGVGRRPSAPRRTPVRLLSSVLLSGVALVPLAGGSPQEPPPVEQIVIGGTTPRFAVPESVPRRPDEASQAACRAITQVLRNDLRFEGLFQFVPERVLSATPPLNPDAPKFEDWKGIGARILVATRADVTGGELTVEAKVYWTLGRSLGRLGPENLAMSHAAVRIWHLVSSGAVVEVNYG